MLQEGRSGSEVERQRMYDSMRGALARVSALGDEISRLGRWLEPRDRTATRVDARGLVDRAIASAAASLQRPPTVEIGFVAGDAAVDVFDRDALEVALGTVIQAVAREAGDEPVVARVSIRHDEESALELLVGPAVRLPSAEVPASPDERDLFPVTQGGLGLSLAVAVAVLDAHAARVWTVAGTRFVAGVRLPVAAQESQP